MEKAKKRANMEPKDRDEQRKKLNATELHRDNYFDKLYQNKQV